MPRLEALLAEDTSSRASRLHFLLLSIRLTQRDQVWPMHIL